MEEVHIKIGQPNIGLVAWLLCSQNDAICNQLWQRPCVQPITPLPFHGHLITTIPYMFFDVALLLLFLIKQMVLCCKTTMTLKPC